MTSSYQQTTTALALFCLTATAQMAFADTKIRTRYTAGGQTHESTLYTQNDRQRMESEQSVLIRQGDQKRTIQINPQSRTYLIIPYASSGGPVTVAAAVTAPTSPKRGGVVESKTTITDTNERKDILGYPARHLRIETTEHASADACVAVDHHISIDGWYIDFEPPAAKGDAQEAALAAAPANTSSCHDEIHTDVNGGAGKLGFPVDYTLQISEKEGSTPAVTRIEVLELSTAAQDPALFEIPADYKQAATFTAYAQATKRPGVTRVAVAAPIDRTVGNKAGLKPGSNHQLAAMLSRAGIDAVPVDSEDQAKQVAADYVLASEVVETKGGAPVSQAIAKAGRFAGLVKGMAKMTPMGAVATSAASMIGGSAEARVEYKLVPSAGGQMISGSVTGSDGNGFNLRNALALAPASIGFAGMAKGGGAAGMFGMFANPGLLGANGGMFSALSMGTNVFSALPTIGGGLTANDQPALLAAFASEAKAVAEALKK